MMRLQAVAALLPGVAAGDIVDWIARGWVQPAGTPPDWVFAEVDVARVRLVRDLRLDAGVDLDSLELVLSLLDQIYCLRGALRSVMGALDEQPEPVRRAVLARLRL